MSEKRPGHIREVKADRDELEHGMLFTFTQPAKDLTERDMLFINTPNNKPMTLVPVEVIDDALVVSARVKPTMDLNFKLVPVDDHTLRLEMEPHQIELKKMGVW